MMVIEKEPMKGLYVIRNTVHIDGRGSFTELHNSEVFSELGIKDFGERQTNFSTNNNVGVLRGLHYQEDPFGQAKLVFCLQGQIADCALDIDVNSPTFGTYYMCQLSGDGKGACGILIPARFAHGYKTLRRNSLVIYITNNVYNPDAERGVRFDDPAFKIKWPETKNVELSPRDLNHPFWKLPRK